DDDGARCCRIDRGVWWRRWLGGSLALPSAADFTVSNGDCLQPLPHRARDAALPQAAGVAGPLADDLNDPARIVYDEVERDGGDDAAILAGSLRNASVRSAETSPGLPDIVPTT